MCRVTMGHLRVTVGHPWVTIGHLRLSIGYLKATVVHIRVTFGHLRVTIGHLRVTIGHLRVTIGYFFSIFKHKANTIEHHPKVRQTCHIFILVCVITLQDTGLNKYFLGTVSSAMIKVLRKVELAICNIHHQKGDDYDYYDDDSCASFRDQLEKFANETSSVLNSKLPGQWQDERKWVAPAEEVLKSRAQCKGMNFFFMKNPPSHYMECYFQARTSFICMNWVVKSGIWRAQCPGYVQPLMENAKTFKRCADQTHASVF